MCKGLNEICRLLILLLHTGTFKTFSSNKLSFSTFNHVNVIEPLLSLGFTLITEVHDNLFDSA
jgi:hypothetical protein